MIVGLVFPFFFFFTYLVTIMTFIGVEFRLNPAGSAIRGRASTSQVTAAKCHFLFFSARVKLIPLTRKRKEASLEKKQGLAESQARFQPGDGKRKRKKCDSKMSFTGSSPVLYMY